MSAHQPVKVPMGVVLDLHLLATAASPLQHGIKWMQTNRLPVPPQLLELATVCAQARRALDAQHAAGVPSVDGAPFRSATIDGQGCSSRCRTVSQVAAAEGVSSRAIRGRIARGTLLAHRTRRGWHIDTEDDRP